MSYPAVAEYRSYRKRQRFITFQPYIPHGALYLRDGPDSGVKVVHGVLCIKLEFADDATLKTVAKVSTSLQRATS